MPTTDRTYYVYNLGNGKGALYIGVTNDLPRRIREHKQKRAKGFTSKYNINQLLYCESFNNIEDAISVEKQIKGWVRKKKLELIRTLNPTFGDLSKEWLQGDE